MAPSETIRPVPPTLMRSAPVRRTPSRGCLSIRTVEYRPADVVAQPLVVKYEITDRLRELIALPPALESPYGLTQALRCRRTWSLDRVGGRAKLVRGDVGDGPGLAGGVRGMPSCPAQVSGCCHRMAAGCASLHHLDLATHPGPAHARSRDAVAGPRAGPTRK